MKKVKLNSKLSFNKETIAKLNDEQMNVVNGGKTVSCNGCPSGSVIIAQCCSLATVAGSKCNPIG